MSILLVRVQAQAVSASDETYLDLVHVRSSNSLLQHVQQLAWDLLPGASQIHATYTDDEGDRCTLTEQTSKDALSFATPHEGIDDTVVLNVVVSGEYATEAPVQSQTPPLTSEADCSLSAPAESAVNTEAQEAPVQCSDSAGYGLGVEAGDCEALLPEPALEADSSRPDPAEVEKLIQPPPVIRRVFQRDSAKKRLQAEQEPGRLSQVAAAPEKDSPQVSMRQPADTDSQIHLLRGVIEQAHIDLADVRQQAADAKLHAREVEEQAEEDAKRHSEESMKYMQETEQARIELRESQAAKELSDQTAQQIHKLTADQALQIQCLEQSLADEQATRKEAEDVKQQMHAQYELADLNLEDSQHQLLHEQTLRREHETKLEDAQRDLNALFEALIQEKRKVAEMEESKQQTDEVANVLQQSLSEEKESLRQALEEATEARDHALKMAYGLQQSLEEEQKKRTAEAEMKLFAENSSDGLQQSLDQKQEELNQLQQSLAESHEQLGTTMIRVTEEQKKRAEAELLADDLQQTLAEQTQTHMESDDSKRDAQEGLQKMFLGEKKAKEEAQSAAHASQELAESLKLTLATTSEAKAEAEVAQTKAHEWLEMLKKKYTEETNARREAENKLKTAVAEDKTAKLNIADLEERLQHANERAAKAEELACDMQRSKAAMPTYSASVHMIEDCPLTLGIEAEEDAAATGDVTKELADLVSSCGAQQAFRIGRIRLPASFSEIAPACARVAVKNSGGVRWPQTTIIVHVEGDNFGLQVMALGVVEPGAVKEIEMDLAVNCKIEGQATVAGHSQKRTYRPRHTMPQLTPRFQGEARSEVRSLWAIVDAATGAHLGPLLVFEAVWDLP